MNGSAHRFESVKNLNQKPLTTDYKPELTAVRICPGLFYTSCELERKSALADL